MVLSLLDVIKTCPQERLQPSSLAKEILCIFYTGCISKQAGGNKTQSAKEGMCESWCRIALWDSVTSKEECGLVKDLGASEDWTQAPRTGAQGPGSPLLHHAHIV